MPTSWKSQIGGGVFRIQFETNNFNYYKMVEKVCQKAIDEADKEREKAREVQMRTLGHL
jgi:hypothetical protein